MGGFSGWLRRLFSGGKDVPMADASAHFADLMYGRPDGDGMSIADIPVTLRKRLQEEAIRAAFHRLEMPLRFLMLATTTGRQPQTLEECYDILNLWRQGLEQEIRLTPDAYVGAVRSYDPSVESDYTVHGQCEPGEPLRIVVPAWRLQGEVVVRGEAEPTSVEPLSHSAAMSPAPRTGGSAGALVRDGEASRLSADDRAPIDSGWRPSLN
jgi:hypothetical protein